MYDNLNIGSLGSSSLSRYAESASEKTLRNSYQEGMFADNNDAYLARSGVAYSDILNEFSIEPISHRAHTSSDLRNSVNSASSGPSHISVKMKPPPVLNLENQYINPNNSRTDSNCINENSLANDQTNENGERGFFHLCTDCWHAIFPMWHAS